MGLMLILTLYPAVMAGAPDRHHGNRRNDARTASISPVNSLCIASILTHRTHDIHPITPQQGRCRTVLEGRRIAEFVCSAAPRKAF